MRGTGGLGALVASALIVGAVLTSVPAADASTPPIERISAPDAVGLAAAVSNRTFPAKTSTVYVATDATYADALAAGGAAGGTSPILLVDPSGLTPTTTAELVRLAPTRVVILGGTAALPTTVADEITAAVSAARVTRVAGADRYETAATLSSTTFTRGASTAFVATGLGFADALAAGPAANGTAPILLTGPDEVPDVTTTELQRLAVKRVVVLGGTAAISDDALDAIRTAVPAAAVTRVAGADRYATAAALSRTIAPSADGTLVVTPGASWTGALVAAPAAARAHAPLLLADGEPGPALSAELLRRGVRHLVVVGALDDAVVNDIEAAATPSIAPPLAGASTAVETAQAQIGKPYEYGAAGPDSYDCSGLTMVAWAAGGVKLPRTSGDQAYAVDTVPFTQLQPGDLLFYGAPIHHVGIYVGDGTMVEAPHTGVPVRTASMWRSDLIAAGRPTTPG